MAETLFDRFPNLSSEIARMAEELSAKPEHAGKLEISGMIPGDITYPFIRPVFCRESLDHPFEFVAFADAVPDLAPSALDDDLIE